MKVDVDHLRKTLEDAAQLARKEKGGLLKFLKELHNACRK